MNNKELTKFAEMFKECIKEGIIKIELIDMSTNDVDLYFKVKVLDEELYSESVSVSFNEDRNSLKSDSYNPLW